MRMFKNPNEEIDYLNAKIAALTEQLNGILKPVAPINELLGESADIRFTPSETAILNLLKHANGRIVRYTVLHDACFMNDHREPSDISILKVYVSRIRKRLTKWEIKSHCNVGYSLEPKGSFLIKPQKREIVDAAA